MNVVRRKNAKDLGIDTEGLELDQVFHEKVDIFGEAPPIERKAAPPPPPPRTTAVEQRDEDTYVLKGVFD